MIPLAEQAGLVVGRALLATWRGQARLALGDADGLNDAREAAETLAHEAHPRTIAAYGNLGDLLRGIGRMADADTAYANAAELGTRFPLPSYTSWIASERAYQAYHAALWSTADELLTEAASPDHNAFDESAANMTRGRMLLARGDIEAALDDAAAIVAYGEASRNDDFLFVGLALEARCHHGIENHEASLEACTRFLTRWNDVRPAWATSRSHCASLRPSSSMQAVTTTSAARGSNSLKSAAGARRSCSPPTLTTPKPQSCIPNRQPPPRRRQPPPRRTTRHPASAAAAAALHTTAVLAFADQTGAIVYRRQAERLAAASA